MKRLFAGGNTPKGFFSYFEEVGDNEERGRKIILKGGPGTGKSSLIRAVGARAEKEGDTVTYYHCSGDDDSLDGVWLHERNVAVLDGTAPHTLEASLPALEDEIYDLGQFLQRPILTPYREEIKSNLYLKSRLFKCAYANLAAAGELYSMNSKLFALCCNEEELHETGVRIGKDLFSTHSSQFDTHSYENTAGQGSAHKDNVLCGNAFCSAITPRGYVSFLRNTMQNMHVCELVNVNCYTLPSVLDRLAASMPQEKILKLCCPLSPYRAEALLFERRRILICSGESDGFCKELLPDYGGEYASKTEYALPTADMAKFTFYHSIVAENESNIARLTQGASQCIYRAKQLHKAAEAFYSAAMDWDSAKERREKLLKEIFET